MGYTKPSVEVSQEQKNNTPVFTTPDLETCLIGHSYEWIDPTLESSIIGTFDGGSEFQFTLSGNSTNYDVKDDEQLVVVDLLGVSGDDIGTVKHLLYGTEFSVNSAMDGTLITCSGTSTSDGSKYQVRAGYRAKNLLTEGVYDLVSISDIEETLGKIVSWNPLAYGAQIAISNSAASVKVLNVELPASGVSGATDVLDAVNDYLGQTDVYVLAPMSQKITYAGLKTHCDTYSEPAEKKERVAFVNNVISYSDEPKLLSSTDKTTLAGTLRDEAAAIQSKRVYIVRPDAGYVLENRHISTIKPSWIEKSFANTTTMSFSTNKLYAKFVSDIIINGVKYKANTLITEDLWSTLINSGWGGSTGLVDVLVPVPGYYYVAQAAGQAIGTSPSQSLTNVAGTGIKETFGSQDIFTETLLNKIAEGGNWIYTQDSKTGAIYCRHQLSSDMTSVAKREFSITKALDYASKFIRLGLKPYIGKYNITTAFLSLVETILNGIGRYLVRENVIKDFKVIQVRQDEINPDTLYIDMEIKVLYPVNYIKVTLIF